MEVHRRPQYGGDYFANANAGLPVVNGTPRPLPTGIFDLEFGMGDIYDDEFTFYLVGAYKHDVKEDGDLSEGSYLNMSATVVMVSSMTTAKTMVYALPPIRRKPELLSRTTKRKTLAT